MYKVIIIFKDYAYLDDSHIFKDKFKAFFFAKWMSRKKGLEVYLCEDGTAKYFDNMGHISSIPYNFVE